MFGKQCLEVITNMMLIAVYKHNLVFAPIFPFIKSNNFCEMIARCFEACFITHNKRTHEQKNQETRTVKEVGRRGVVG